MALTYCRVERWGRIALAAPETKNKLSTGLLRELRALIERAAGEGLAALSVESASPEIFAAGADMRELLALDPSKAKSYAALGQSTMAALEAFPAPTFALVAGPCFGGGFDLALACDYIWADRRALFCHPGVYLGMVTGFGGTVRLPERLPASAARYMLATGARMKSERAHRLGLVDALFEDQPAMIGALAHMAARDELPAKRAHR